MYEKRFQSRSGHLVPRRKLKKFIGKYKRKKKTGWKGQNIPNCNKEGKICEWQTGKTYILRNNKKAYIWLHEENGK